MKLTRRELFAVGAAAVLPKPKVETIGEWADRVGLPRFSQKQFGLPVIELLPGVPGHSWLLEGPFPVDLTGAIAEGLVSFTDLGKTRLDARIAELERTLGIKATLLSSDSASDKAEDRGAS